MRYTRLGNTGLIVSRLSFGAMTLLVQRQFGRREAEGGSGIVGKMR